MKANPIERLKHVQSAAQTVIDFSPIDLKDIKTYGAVVYQLQIVGEALKHVPKEWLEPHANIPWKRVIAFRNYAVHEYFQLDLQAIHKAINMLPDMILTIESIITEHK
ncbi:MAG: DUF86 domain-containing protein [Alphaproteobacteria bacterium]|nr:DUF86 domain-containing protein [Alphaproteobacteria bacterium]